MKINEAIINFGVYEDSTEYYGMAEVGLPEIAYIVNETQGAGIAGKFESIILGHFEAMTLTLNFRTPNKDAIALLEPREHQIEMRAAIQEKETVKNQTKVVKVKHVAVCKPKQLALGKLASAAPADASGEYACTY